MGTLANSEDPDEMPHNVAFHQGLHCLLRQNQSSEKEMQYFLEIITCDTSIYTMDHPDLIVSNGKFHPSDDKGPEGTLSASLDSFAVQHMKTQD